MTADSKIQWTDSTFNPWVGCTNISPGCDHCYAEALMDTRYGKAHWGAGQPRVRTSVENWKQPIRWNKLKYFECLDCGHRQASKQERGEGYMTCEACSPFKGKAVSDKDDAGNFKETRRRVFCASLADVFDNEVPIEWRADLFALIAATPNLDWLLLTKRIGNVADMMSLGPWPENIWLGATVINQEEADRDIPKLLQIPARVRFLSCEPLLGPIVLRDPPNDCGEPRYSYLRRVDEADPASPRIDWVIVGGESGGQAREFHVEWADSIVAQCRAAGVACFVKQIGARPMMSVTFDARWTEEKALTRTAPIEQKDRKGGDWGEWPERLRVREFPKAAAS